MTPTKNFCAAVKGPSCHPGSIPFAFRTGKAAGAFTKSMNAAAAAFALELELSPLVNTTYV